MEKSISITKEKIDRPTVLLIRHAQSEYNLASIKAKALEDKVEKLKAEEKRKFSRHLLDCDLTA